ncbi:hypothetical protein AVEN_111285-1 [Araneus ventricosus]|uniref:Uncharacterized protein n=1 Tax=Araneus ventricosus TaxID=182803 RepID=A0A4Y2FI32_ARAVE|nr:hypothetical protein AVEN_111285-1 [Araneus ventricosus]
MVEVKSVVIKRPPARVLKSLASEYRLRCRHRHLTMVQKLKVLPKIILELFYNGMTSMVQWYGLSFGNGEFQIRNPIPLKNRQRPVDLVRINSLIPKRLFSSCSFQPGLFGRERHELDSPNVGGPLPHPCYNLPLRRTEMVCGWQR